MRSLMPTSREIVCRYENKDHSGKQFSSRASNCLFFKILTEESKLESPVGMDIHVFGIKLESVLNCGSEFRLNRDPVVETACYQTTSQGSGFHCRSWSEDLSHTFGNLIWLPRPDLNKDRHSVSQYFLTKLKIWSINKESVPVNRQKVVDAVELTCWKICMCYSSRAGELASYLFQFLAARSWRSFSGDHLKQFINDLLSTRRADSLKLGSPLTIKFLIH